MYHIIQYEICMHIILYKVVSNDIIWYFVIPHYNMQYFNKFFVLWFYDTGGLIKVMPYLGELHNLLLSMFRTVYVILYICMITGTLNFIYVLHHRWWVFKSLQGFALGVMQTFAWYLTAMMMQVFYVKSTLSLLSERQVTVRHLGITAPPRGSGRSHGKSQFYWNIFILRVIQ